MRRNPQTRQISYSRSASERHYRGLGRDLSGSPKALQLGTGVLVCAFVLILVISLIGGPGTGKTGHLGFVRMQKPGSSVAISVWVWPWQNVDEVADSLMQR